MAKTKRVLPPLENERYYHDTVWLALPLLALPCYFYGARPAVLCLVAILLANLCDRIEARLRGTLYNHQDCSSESFAALLAMLMPASVPWHVLVVAVLACVLLGKGAFGGYGSYPFHPTAVGYAVAAISWPGHMFVYPQPFTKLPMMLKGEVALVSGMSETLKNGGLPIISDFELLLGDVGGAMGTTAVLVLLACAFFLWARRNIHMSTVLSFFAVCALISFFFPRQEGLSGAVIETLYERLNVVKFEFASGGLLYGGIFLISEPYTCPKHWLSRLVYGGLLAVLTMMFRYYGVYETGICFALLMLSTVASWIDRNVVLFVTMQKANRALKRAELKQKKGGATA